MTDDDHLKQVACRRPSWSLELYSQFNARLHRQGQDRPVIVHHIVARDTVDETVLGALARKDMTQRALLEALKHDALKRDARGRAGE